MDGLMRFPARRASVGARLGGPPAITTGTTTGYPWADGDTLYATDLNAAVAYSASVYDITAFGAKSDGVADDATAVSAAIAAACSAGGGKIILPPGRTLCCSAIVTTIPAGVVVTLEGAGIDASELYFSHATDGLSFELSYASNTWGAVNLRGFTVTRGATSPVVANTGVNIFIDPAIATLYGGSSSLRDVRIWGGGGNLSFWQNGLVLSGIAGATIEDVIVIGQLAGATDRGDVGMTFAGSGNNYASSYSMTNSQIIGASCGLLIGSWVQGCFVSNMTIIAQYDSVRFMSFPGGPSAEDFAIVNSTLSASHRCVYIGLATQCRVNGCTFLCFNQNVAGGFAGVELNQTAFNSVIGNNIIGANLTNEIGVLVSACTGFPNTIVGNITGNWGGIGVKLSGNTSGTTVVGNSFPSGGGAVSQDTPGNTILANTWQGVSDQLATPYPVRFYSTSSGVPRWFVGNAGNVESGSDSGSDFEIVSAHDDGSLSGQTLAIKRSTGVATLLYAPIIANLPINAANDAAAASAGVQLGGVYRNGSQLMVRVV